MRYFEMFTGIAGFSKGIERAYGTSNQFESENGRPDAGRDWPTCKGRRDVRYSSLETSLPKCVGFSEIARVPCGILRYRYPDVRNYGDATAIICDELPDFDFLCGGFPCQAFSIAGKRQGFDDTRGTLFHEIARVLSHKRPRHFLLENVEGLRSHEEGKTLQEILRILAELDYRVEVVLLNSKHYGVPQNRERIFFIGHLGAECRREILSFGDSNGEAFAPGPVGTVSGTISTKNQSGQCQFDGSTTLIYGKDGRVKNQDVASCFTAGGNSGGNHSDMDLIQVGTLRTHKNGEGFRPMSEEISPSLNARARQDGSQQTVVAIPQGINHPSRGIELRKDGQAATLKGGQSGTQRPKVAIPVLTPDRKTKRQNGRRMKDDGDESFTLTSQDRHGVMVKVADGSQGQRVYDETGIAAAVRSIQSGGAGGAQEKYQIQNRIRRLTPVECARLQGFEDDWADFGMFQNKQGEWHIREISDTGKYQVFGNAVTVSVIAAIIGQMRLKGCLTEATNR